MSVASHTRFLHFKNRRERIPMRKMISRLLAGMLAFLACFTMLPGERALAEDAWKLGETIYWNWDDTVVTVTGYGDMYDFDSNGKYSDYYVPGVCESDYFPHGWGRNDYTVSFSSQTERITYVGDYAFCGY